MGKSHARCLIDKKNGKGKKKEIVCFLFCLPRDSPFAPMSRSPIPSVKYVYAIDYKSMIGGYRILLVMNSVNPLLIPL
jgi:hypothetical protein